MIDKPLPNANTYPYEFYIRGYPKCKLENIKFNNASSTTKITTTYVVWQKISCEYGYSWQLLEVYGEEV